MTHRFTGRHMAAVMVAGFGVVVAVNVSMAMMATHGFGGVVVENSYVASQKFNGWLEESRREQALGWNAAITRDSEGRLEVVTRQVPAGAQVSAQTRRPLGAPETVRLDFAQAGQGRFVSTSPLPGGRWIVRLTIEKEGRRWSSESAIE